MVALEGLAHAGERHMLLLLGTQVWLRVRGALGREVTSRKAQAPGNLTLPFVLILY